MLTNTLPVSIELSENITCITMMQTDRTGKGFRVIEEVFTVSLIPNVVIRHRLSWKRKIVWENATREENKIDQRLSSESNSR